MKIPRHSFSKRRKIHFNSRADIVCKECGSDLYRKYCYSQHSRKTHHRCLDCALGKNIITTIPATIKNWLDANKQEVYA